MSNPQDIVKAYINPFSGVIYADQGKTSEINVIGFVIPSGVLVDGQLLHSSLGQLLADDHTQYILVDASRGFSNIPFTTSVSGISDPNQFTTKAYVDALVGSGSGGGAVGALMGSDGITVLSGISITTIQGFRSEFVAASGSLQSQISGIPVDIDRIESAIIGGSNISVVSGTNTTTISASQPPAIIAGTNVVVTSGSDTITIAVSDVDIVPNAIVAGTNITVISGSNTITISSTAAPNALVGSDGITVVSGSNTTTIQGFHNELVLASGYLQGQISSIDLGGGGGTSKALIGTDGITITSGTNTIGIGGFRPEFVSASGFIQSQIDNLDATYATDAQLSADLATAHSELVSVSGNLQTQITSVQNSVNNLDATYATDAQVASISGHLQTAIDAVEATDVDTLNGLSGSVTITAAGYSSSATQDQTITITTPVPNAIVGGGDVSVVSGSNTVRITDNNRALISAGGIIITSGTSTISVSSNVSNALISAGNITITSGSNTTSISAGVSNALVSAGGVTIISGTNQTFLSSAIPNALISAGNLTITSGTSQTFLSAGKENALVAGSNVTITSGTSTTTITATQPPAIVAGQNVVVTSGTNTITIAANPASAPALIAGPNITIVSGSNTTTITASQPPAIVSGDNFINVVSGTNTITITPDAIVSSSANLTVTSGTSTLTLAPSATPSFTSVTATTVTGTTGQFAGTISAQRGDFSQGLTVSGLPVSTGGGTGAGTPGGADTQVQYNSSGSFAGSANLTFDGTTLTAANDVSISGITSSQMARKDAAQQFTRAQGSMFVNVPVVAGALAPDLTLSNYFETTLTTNVTGTITLTNIATSPVGASYTWVFRQDGAGNRTVRWPGFRDSWHWQAGQGPTMTTSGGGIDIVQFMTVTGSQVLAGFSTGLT